MGFTHTCTLMRVIFRGIQEFYYLLDYLYSWIKVYLLHMGSLVDLFLLRWGICNTLIICSIYIYTLRLFHSSNLNGLCFCFSPAPSLLQCSLSYSDTQWIIKLCSWLRGWKFWKKTFETSKVVQFLFCIVKINRLKCIYRLQRLTQQVSWALPCYSLQSGRDMSDWYTNMH